MAESTGHAPPTRRASLLSIVKKNAVSSSEVVFHELSVEGVESRGESPQQNMPNESSSSGSTYTNRSPRESWAQVPPAINTVANITVSSAALEEEGGSLDLGAVDFRVDVPYRFKVHLKNLEEKDLIVTCDPPSGAAVKIATHGGKSVVTYLCTVTPLQEGTFTISALLGKKSVLGSPYQVTFSPPADASLCTVEEAPEECRTSVDKDTLTFCVHTNQERDGILTASVKSLLTQKSVPVMLSQAGKGHYDVEFDALDGKKYRLAIKFDNQHINGSPFFINLSNALACQASGKGLTHAVASYDNKFEVSTEGAGPGELKVVIEGKANLVPKIKSKGDVFVVTYTPKKAGSYSISILWMEDEIPGSPFFVTCYKPPSVTVPKPDKSSTYLLGEVYKFKVDTKEAGEGVLDASCDGLEGKAKVEVVNKGGGQHRVRITPQATGNLFLSIKWADLEIPGSPFQLQLDEKANTSLVAVSGPAYEVGSSHPVVLEVNTVKGGAGKLKATCIGATTGNVNTKVVQTQPKVHFVSFDPPKPDVYTLWVTWSKQQVPGSPFHINLLPLEALNCGVVGAPDVPQDWTEPATLIISIAGAGNGEMEARAEGQLTGPLAKEHVQVREAQQDMMEVTLRAPAQDMYSLYVTWSGEDIPQSPFQLNRLLPEASKCIASPPRSGVDWSSPVHIHIDASKAGNGKLKALAIGDERGDVSEYIEILPTSNQVGHYDINFTAPTPGYYTLTAEWASDPIPGFPVRLNQNQLKPLEVEVVDPPAGILKVGQSISLGVDASRGGPGQMTGKCSGKKDEDISVIVEKVDGEGEKFKVSFTPLSEDVYSLSVLWEGKDIKGSPFNIDLIPVNAALVKATCPMHPQGLEGPVQVSLSAEETGKAPISAICMGGKSGRVPVEIETLSYYQYMLSFIPPQPDLFTMGVKYGGQNITSSPFYINTYPPNVSAVRVTPPSEGAVPGKPVSYLCDTSNAGHAWLQAEVVGKRSQSTTALEIDQAGTTRFTASFTPDAADVYTVSIKWGEEEVAGSPFLLNLQPVDASLVKVGDVYIPDESGLEYVSVTVDCTDVGPAPVTANVIGRSMNSAPTEIEALPDCRYCVKFVPPKDDTYNLSIFYNDKDIPGSPFVISMVSPQPEKVRLVSTHIPNQATPTVTLTLDTEDAGKGSLRANITGQKCGEVTEYQVEKREGGTTWKVSFTPPSPDTFFISCFWARTEIPGSPFVVDMTLPVASNVVVSNSHIPEDAGVGEEAWVELDCSAAGHGVVLGQVEEASSFGNFLDTEVEEVGPRRYRVTFTPRDPSLYFLSVRYGRDHIDGSPFEVDRQPAWPDKVKIIEKTLPKFSDGSAALVALSTEEAGRGRLTAGLRGEVSGEVALVLKDVARKTFTISFTPPHPDSYTLSVYLADLPVSFSPLLFNVLQPICPEKVVCGELTCSAPREMATMDVSTAGAGFASLTASCVGEKSGEVEVRVEMVGGGREEHRVLFTPLREDVYSLSVSYAGTPVPGCPFSLDLVPRELVDESFHSTFLPSPKVDLRDRVKDLRAEEPEADIDLKLGMEEREQEREEVDVEEEGNVFFQYMGEPVTISVAAEEVEEKERGLVAVATGEKTDSADILVTATEDGCYDIVFNPDLPDLYTIEISLGGVPIPGSPFRIAYKHYTDPSKCFIFNADNVFLPLSIGEEVKFSVDATQGGISMLKASVNNPLGREDGLVQVEEIGHQVYQICYTATAPGLHHIHLKWANGYIPESPVELHVRDGPEIPVYRHGDPVSLHLKAQASPGEISAVAMHLRSKVTYKVKITALRGSGKFCILYPTSDPGVHMIRVFLRGKEIMGSPFYVSYAQPSDPTACAVSGFHGIGHIGQTMEFVIDTSAAGFGGVSVRAVLPSTGLQSSVNIKDRRDGTYLVQYTPQSLGEHLMNVLWYGSPIPGSPFQVKVGEEEREEEEEEGRETGLVYLVEEHKGIFQEPHPIGIPFKFTISTAKAGRGTLSFSSHGPGKPSIQVSDNKDKTFTCSILSKEAGDYKIDVLWNHAHIPSSPFPISFFPSKAIKVLGLNLSSGPGHGTAMVTVIEEDLCVLQGPCSLGKEVEFRLFTGNAGQGELTVSCVGPGKPEVSVDEGEEGTHTCHLMPGERGNYRVFILWNKLHIPGSPFSFFCLPTKAIQVLGLNPSCEAGKASNVSISEADRVKFSEPQPLEPVEFQIQTKDGAKGELCISAKGPGDVSVDVLEPAGDGVQRCTLTATTAGEYAVYILWNNRHISGSPFALCLTSEKARKFLGLVSPSTEAAIPLGGGQVFLFAEDVEVFKTPLGLDQLAVFRVSTAGAGRGVVSIMAHGPGELQVRVERCGGGVFSCSLLATIAGKYVVEVLWNQDQVAGSPVEAVFQSSEPQITGISLENAVLQVAVTHGFKVHYEQVGRGDLCIYCRPSDGAKIALSPVATGKYYHCQVTPVVPGHHSIFVQYNGRDVVGSPFCVHFDPKTAHRIPTLTSTPPIPHNIEVWGPGLGGGCVGQEGNFVIQTAKAGSGELDLTVSGPCGGFKVQVRQHWEDEQMLLVRYDPVLAGMYRLVIRWAGIEVPDSPFVVHITDQMREAGN